MSIQPMCISPRPGRSSKSAQRCWSNHLFISEELSVVQCRLGPAISDCVLAQLLWCGTNVLDNWQMAMSPQSERCEIDPRISRDKGPVSIPDKTSYHKISWNSKLRDRYIEFYDRSGIWQAPRKQRYQRACQFSKWCNHLNQFSSFEQLRYWRYHQECSCFSRVLTRRVHHVSSRPYHFHTSLIIP